MIADCSAAGRPASRRNHVQNNWTDLQIGGCTGPVADWHSIWPHLKRYE